MKQKNYSFENVSGANNANGVELHSKRHRFHFFAKLVCLLLALIFWLLVTYANRESVQDENTEKSTPKEYEHQIAIITETV